MLLWRARRDSLHGRWSPAALALVLIAAQGATALHFALVKHEYCPETGGFIHPGASPHKQASTHRANGPGLYSSEEEEGSHPEHCALVGLRRNVALPPEASAILPIDSYQTVVELGEPWALPSSTRLRLAPKQSPPA